MKFNMPAKMFARHVLHVVIKLLQNVRVREVHLKACKPCCALRGFEYKKKQTHVLFVLVNSGKTYRSGESKTNALTRIRRKAIRGKNKEHRQRDLMKRHNSVLNFRHWLANVTHP
jgi:hypothetical protein